MLSHLQISNFTLVEQLELELHKGLSALTGETGAGKSILLDALALVLGDRADADKVRHGAERADIQASFNLAALPWVSKWLKEQDLGEGDECLLRRVVTQEGRSRAFINGQSVTLQQLKCLGDMLVDIHGQHEHQSLLKNRTQLRLLDAFGQQRKLAKEVKRAYFHWHCCKERLEQLQNQSDEINARFQLLSYQVDELEQLELGEHEINELENEQKQLANIEHIQHNCQHLNELCSDDEQGLISRLHSGLKLLNELGDTKSTKLQNVESLLEQALINVQEAHNDVEREQQNQELDPKRLQEIDQRLSRIYDVARKHRVMPEELYALQQQLNGELQQLQSGDKQIEALESELAEYLLHYRQLADQLSQVRQQAAEQLQLAVNGKLAQLAMGHANFVASLQSLSEQPHSDGNEQVQFLISTSPGQAPKALAKIASGGELSRISLAIQVVTAQTSTIPTLIFDEVDVGIGGTTGDIVGELLRELGEQGQVLCVTHLAQVASKAHHHLRVEKTIEKDAVNSSLSQLGGDEKIMEIARMMGGAIDSEQSLAHARAMLANNLH
ncbi:DNA repair protein RecN [Agaribacterium haliotis]|uniref:DNA repair protein RecN n=1 Tax=Agaribacterium haliotis TaxID=2013869 RepID=UPI000BB552B3|nr:DNA repair protein RecN [Agaribacterium haliotis]